MGAAMFFSFLILRTYKRTHEKWNHLPDQKTPRIPRKNRNAVFPQAPGCVVYMNLIGLCPALQERGYSRDACKGNDPPVISQFSE